MTARRQKMKRSENPNEITVEQVKASRVLPSTSGSFETAYERVGGNEDGSVWFKDTVTMVCYKVVRLTKTGELAIGETRQLRKRKEEKPKTAVIICCECEQERIVSTQDAFQVKRCMPCQKRYRNKKRTERAKVKRAEKRRTRELETLNGNQTITE